MKCEMCKGETVIERRRYHYTECGLDNVYLENIEVRVCAACGVESPRIPRINEVHRIIGRAIALQDAPLSGSEVRFLRKHLGLKAKEWAAYLRTNVSTLSRWENDQQPIGDQSDTLIRILYFYLSGTKAGDPLPESVAEQIAKIIERRDEIPAVFVNPQNKPGYSYGSLAELAFA